METIRDIFGRPAPDALQPLLRVLDCSDIMDLAGMYGEARERGDSHLMAAINERMGVVMREQGLVAPNAELTCGQQPAKEE